MAIVQLHSKQYGPFKDTEQFEFKDTQFLSFDDGTAVTLIQSVVIGTLNIGAEESLSGTSIIDSTTSESNITFIGESIVLDGTSSIVLNTSESNIELDIALNGSANIASVVSSDLELGLITFLDASSNIVFDILTSTIDLDIALTGSANITSEAGDDLTLGIDTALDGTASIVFNATAEELGKTVGLWFVDGTSDLIISNVAPAPLVRSVSLQSIDTTDSLIISNIEAWMHKNVSMLLDITSSSSSSGTISFDVLGFHGTATIISNVINDSTAELDVGRIEEITGTAPIVSNYSAEKLLTDPIIDMSSVNIFSFTDSTATIVLGIDEPLSSTSSIISNIPNPELTIGVDYDLSGTSSISSTDNTSNLTIGNIETLDSSAHIQSVVTGFLDPTNPLTATTNIVSDISATLKQGLDRDLEMNIEAETSSSGTLEVLSPLSSTVIISSNDATSILTIGIPQSLDSTSTIIQSVVSTSELTIGIPVALDGTASITFDIDSTGVYVGGVIEVLSGSSDIVCTTLGDLVLGDPEELTSTTNITSNVASDDLSIFIPLTGTVDIDSTAYAYIYRDGIIEDVSGTSTIQSNLVGNLATGIITPVSGTSNITSNIPLSDLTIGIPVSLDGTADITFDTSASIYIGNLLPEVCEGTASIISNATAGSIILEVLNLDGVSYITSEVDGTLILGAAVNFESGTASIVSNVSSDPLIVEPIDLSGTSSITSLVSDANLIHDPWPPVTLDASCSISSNVQGTTLEYGATTQLTGTAYIDPKVDGFIYLGQITPLKASTNIQFNLSDSSNLAKNIIELSSTGFYLASWVQHFDNTELTVYDNGSWDGAEWDTEYDTTSNEWSLDLHPYAGHKDTKYTRYKDTLTTHWIRNFDAINYRPTKVRVTFDSTSEIEISIQTKNGAWLVDRESVYSREPVDITFGSYDFETLLITSNDPITVTNIEFFEGVGVPCHIQSEIDGVISRDYLVSGSSDISSLVIGGITGADEALDGTAYVTSSLNGTLGFDISLSGTASLESNISGIFTEQDEVLEGSANITSDVSSAILVVPYNGTGSIYSNVSGTLSIGIGKALDSSSCLIISNVTGTTLNIDPVISGRRKTTYDLQYWFSEYVVESELNISQLPFLSTESVYFRNDSFIELLFNEDYDSSDYKHLYREETEKHLWPSVVRERLMVRPSSAQYYMCCDSTAEGGINLYNLHTDDLTMLDTLLYYRLQPESATLVGIDYEDLRTNISKMIYMYLDLKINDNFSLFDHSEMMSGSTDLLEICYESYLIEQVFTHISQQGT